MIELGYADKKLVGLDKEDLRTHILCLGGSQEGKSRLIQQVCRELTNLHKGFLLIDPHGTLYTALLAWMSRVEPNRAVIPIDFSRGVVGFNPFLRSKTKSGSVMTVVDRMVSATMTAWDTKQSNNANYPRLLKILTIIYYALVQHQLPFSYSSHFLRHKSPERDALIAQMPYDVQEMAVSVYKRGLFSFTDYTDSAQSRLRMFIHERVRQVFAMPPVDIPKAINDRAIVLVNAHAVDDFISQESCHVLGALLINAFVENFLADEGKREYFLIIDEAQLYLSRDIERADAEAAKRGLHLFISAHSEKEYGIDIAATMRNAGVRIQFDARQHFNLTRPDKETVRVKTKDVLPNPVTWLDDYLAKITEPYRVEPAPEPETEPQPTPTKEPPRVEPTPVTYDFTNLSNTEIAQILLRDYRVLLLSHCVALSGRPYKAMQVTFRHLGEAGKCVAMKEKKGTKNRKIYCYLVPGKEYKQLEHDLLITEFHIANRQRITRWQQDKIRDEWVNPDAYFEAGELCFFLEVENANPSYESGISEWLSKAKRYAAYADAQRHKHQCRNFRVLFILPTEQRAKNLRKTIQESDITNLGRFWIGWHGNNRFICPADNTFHELP